MVVKQESYLTGTPTPHHAQSAPPTPAVAGTIPLSASQERAWFLEQLQPGSAGHHVLAAWQLTGPLDTAALQQSANQLIGRHAILRATFTPVDGRPVQHIGPAPDFNVSTIDLRHLPVAEQAAEAQRLAQAEAHHPFDLVHGPLLRLTLLQLAEAEHILLVTMHRIAADRRSLQLFIQELAAGYAQEHAPVPSNQYTDLARHELAWLGGADAQAQMAFWLGRLGGDLPILEIPANHPRPVFQTFNGARCTVITLPASLVSALQALGQEEEASLATTLLAAFKTLLHRYTKQEDILVGVPVGNLGNDGQGVIGPLDNTLVLRTHHVGNPTFRELVGRVQETVAAAYAHRELPFAALVNGLQPARNLSHPPVFQVSFDHQEAERPPIEAAGLILRHLELDPAVTRYDLSLLLTHQRDEIIGTLEYNTDLFDATTIERMAGHFHTLLEGIADDPDRPLSNLPFLTETERRQLLVTWNETTAYFPNEAGLHTLFEDQVRRTPDAPALLFEGERLSYDELNRRANQLAHRLKKLGIGPEIPAGVFVERSTEMVVALLAILKAGGLYVPLDPAYPPERVAFMLADADTPVVLTQASLLDRLPEHHAEVFCLDTDWDSLDNEPQEDPAGGAHPLNLAYLIYTSGSTGRPKGVAIAHRSAVALLTWAAGVFPPEALQGVLAATSICFDLSVYELFLPLSLGGTIILARDALHLLTLPGREAVTLINTVPSAMAELARTRGIPDGVRIVNLAGEPLQRALVQQVYESSRVQQVYNLYGPSEDTTYSTFTVVPRDDPAEPAIGRPISNTQAYILDAYLQPVPVGVVGELYLGGDGLSRCYLNRPALTAEKYVPNPFAVADQVGGRLYKTGDLARCRPDSSIEFLGRIDHQVKIRGFRIELGEIEANLSRHPAVESVVVMVQEDGTGDKRLVAYLATRQPAPSVSELRRHLQEKLPDYMVPAVFLFLETMPLTPNGKINRKALAALPLSQQDRPELEDAFVAPQTAAEQALASIWCELLQLERVGTHDNFFELGGHSLLATRALSRLAALFRVELPLPLFFEQPTIAGLSRELEAAQPATRSAAAPLQPAAREGAQPLSFSQQRLWFFEQLTPNSPLYNIPFLLDVSGSLDSVILERCLNEIVRRHEVLRATFHELNGRPQQLFQPPQPVPFTRVDLRPLAPTARLPRARQLLREQARQPFDLARGPLVRAMLIQLDDNNSQFLLVVHHLVFDGWSLGILLEEIETLYHAFAAGEPSPLPELALQFGDYVYWQHQTLEGEALQQLLNTWQAQFSGPLPALTLPTDRPRPAAQMYRGARLARALPPTLVDNLEELGRRENASLFMTMLAAFQTLLSRYSGQTDLIVGAPFAGRNLTEIEGLLGFFVNTLPLRVDLSGKPTFRQLLKRVQQVALTALAHQDLPLEKLLQNLSLERDPSRNPLFQVVFALQNTAARPAQLPGARLSYVEELDTNTAKFDLTLFIEFPESGPVAVMEYNSDLFEAESIGRMIDHFQALLAGIVADPDCAITSLPLLTEAEREQLLVAWNSTQTGYPNQATAHELFAAQAAQTPAATALVLGAERLTYAELDRRTNQLAHHLQALGVGPEVFVGLFMERSIEMIVATLATLKAGGAYVPIDPAYPPDRIAFMLQDTGTPILLTQERLVDRLPQHTAHLICLDSQWNVVATASADTPYSRTTADNTAYVMYTSGSTGRPKGVRVTHRNIVRLVKETNYVHFGPEEVFLQFASISFDAATFEIWGSLLNGAELVLFPAAKASLAEIAQVIEENRVTTLWLTAGLFHQMVEYHLNSFRNVRQLLAGGDVLSPTHVRRVLQTLPGCTLINGYGPTESTTFATYYPMKDASQVDTTVSIGRPIANTQGYVLDAQLNPVPIGVPGELYIGGDGLALGYLNRPALTAERFVPHPFSAVPGARLYKTGDLVRYRSAGDPGKPGTLEFLGRNDFQVKVRGFRIELGEIEAVLAQHEAIQETIVVAYGRSAAEKQLVAYLVPKQTPGPASAELRRYVRERLPDYMVPNLFIALDAFPLTANGKVNRDALPAPEQSSDAPEDFVAPRTPIEEVLADMWARLLPIRRVGATDNFFDLGGHSLLATQLISRIRQVFQVELPLLAFFAEPTVAGLAQHLEAARQTKRPATATAAPAAPTARSARRDQPLALSFAQERLWFLDQLEPNNPVYNIPAAIRLRGRLDVTALEQSLNAIVQRHEALRTTFTQVDNRPVQVIQPSVAFHFTAVAAAAWLDGDEVETPLVDLEGFPASAREMGAWRLATRAARRPFDLSRDALVRVCLLRLDKEDHLLLLIIHHVIADGWSMGLIFKELAALYDAFTTGRPSLLPELPLQYADFAQWQREWLASGVIEQQLAYWRQKLEGANYVLELPADRPRPPMQSFRGQNYHFSLPAELTAALNQLSQREGSTLFMTLLAAFNVLLYRYTGQEDILAGSPIANRHRGEIEELIGFFVNTLVLRGDLGGNPTFRQFLQQVRQTTLEAFDHQDIPFERIVEALQPERDLSRQPLFQVMFVLQNAPMTLKLGDLALGFQFVGTETAKFDLLLTMEEGEQGLVGTLEYNTDLFTAATVQRIATHFQTLLAALAVAPDQRIAEVALLSPAERQQLVHEWNDTRLDTPFDRVHDLFARQAARTPGQVAVQFDAATLSYEELNRRANQLAHALRHLGVRPDVKVVVCLERSAEMMIGVLAALKAGGAYVPVDPAYPAERVQFMLADTQAPVVLTQRHLLEKLQSAIQPAGEAHALPGPTLFCLDSDWADIVAGQPTTDPVSGATPDNLAYVIYTSGSTGQPKGVMMTHRALSNLITWQLEHTTTRQAPKTLQFASLSFDVSFQETFATWLTGGTLLLISEAVRRDAPALWRLLAEERVERIFLPFVAMQALAEAAAHGAPVSPTLREMVTAGEQLQTSPSIIRLFEQLPECTLHNHYGPSESHVVTAYTLSGPPDGWPALPPIGRPVANTQIYLLDRHLRPVPVGVAGELYIAGVSLARGYLNRPGLTAGRFLPDPFATEPGARMYQTGDVARFLPDGNIEYLGRADFQVKVRGYRIELSEIEVILSQHPAVRETIAAVREDMPGQKQLVAYFIPEVAAETPTVNSLRHFLLERLPEYMVPTNFVALDSWPLTPSGKLNRRALPRPEGRPELETAYVAPLREVERTIASVWQEVLQVERVGLDDNFFDLGGHSLLLVQVHGRLHQQFSELSVVDLFKYPTVRALAHYLHPDTAAAPAVAAPTPRRPGRAGVATDTEIAIIGLAGRFPGAPTITQFWQNVRDGVESITFFDDETLLQAGVDPTLLRDPDFVKAGAILEDIDLFDADFFGFTPREAEATDPQHRFFLECAWEALENSGYDPESYSGLIGVFAGASQSSYLLNNLSTRPDLWAVLGDLQVLISTDKDYVPSRVAYKLNLKGPAVNVQSACSTSLVAVHAACQSLLHGECDMALAGGVTVRVPHKTGYLYVEDSILSPDGHCRAFDANARGTVASNGVGVVVLKRLADALADGDPIYAVIKGSAINNDGALKVGYTAPSVAGQAAVIQQALASAGVASDSIGYVETHGTGTALGDPIEVAALTQAFRQSSNRQGFCGLSSLKTNVGHLDAAAGVAGLIKATLALQHGIVPPNLHFQEPNPGLDLERSPFYISPTARPWPAGPTPRRVGVSSFGIGGTNAHAILEEAPPIAPTGPSRPYQLLLLSAKTESALDAATQKLAAYLQATPDASLADVAYTLQVGRRRFAWRRMLVCASAGEASEALQAPDPKRVFSLAAAQRSRPVLFMFPGQGAQYVNMGRDLYEAEAVFREVIDTCAVLLEPQLGLDLRHILYPPAGAEEAATAQLTQTAITQPALFVIEYALARLWQSWGVQPQAMIGHSIGEYAAACLAGVFSLADALALVAARGRLMQSLPAGAMLAVSLPEAELRSWLNEELALAAVNGPALCVVSGPAEAIEALEAQLTVQEVICRRLHTSHAFHSAMMDPILAEFGRAVAGVTRRPPQIPFVSNVSGTWITADEATSPAYWTSHLRQTVRFAGGAAVLLQEEDAVLLEVGPGRTLSTLARAVAQQAGNPAGRTILSSLRHPGDQQPDVAFILDTVGRLWLAGASLDWPGYYAGERRLRLPLPTYPFQRRRYWVEPGAPAARGTMPSTEIRKRPDMADWFYVPIWQQSAPAVGQNGHVPPAHWLVFSGDTALDATIIERLRQAGQQVTTVTAGAAFQQLGAETYTIQPERGEDYAALLAALGAAPDGILHLWGLKPAASFAAAQRHGFYSLLYLAQALDRANVLQPIRLHVVSNNSQEVTGGDLLYPEKLTPLGLCRVLPQEYPHLTCRYLDLDAPGGDASPRLARLLAADLLNPTSDLVVAYRGGRRWVQGFAPLRLETVTNEAARLRPGGVYLITGGLGQVGLPLATYLAQQVGARLALVGRSTFPGRHTWAEWLAAHPEGDPVSGKIRSLQALEAAGGEALLIQADTGDAGQMQRALEQTMAQFGALHGVFHLAGAVQDEDFSPVQETTPAHCEAQFQAKARGVEVLAEVLQKDDLDFCLLFSSLSSVLGGFAFAAYAAASQYMDAFTGRHQATTGTPWITVDWDGWLTPDMAGQAKNDLAMTLEEGLEACRRILALEGVPQVIVSTGDLQARIEKWVQPQAATAAESPLPESAASDGHSRPDLATAYAAPRDDIEQTIAGLWQTLLGVTGVGIYDDFFDLGGHSLLGTQLVARLRKVFEVELPMRCIFEAKTIADLAGVVKEKQTEQVVDEEMEETLAMLEGLSDEEVAALLAALPDEEA